MAMRFFSELVAVCMLGMMSKLHALEYSTDVEPLKKKTVLVVSVVMLESIVESIVRLVGRILYRPLAESPNCSYGLIPCWSVNEIEPRR